MFEINAIAIPTELPDSLEDAAEIAAKACADFSEMSGALGRCRVDFDTSAGDETYTLLKQSTEFMQNFVTYLSYRLVPGMQEQRQSEMMKVAQARAELQAMLNDSDDDDNDGGDNEEEQEKFAGDEETAQKKAELIQILENGGRDPDYKWEGPVVRVYFPDEGSAALARRDWNPTGSPNEAKVPQCVQFSSCGGVQMQDVSKDMLVIFNCPKAAESDSVEEILQRTETQNIDSLKLTIFVNPNLVEYVYSWLGACLNSDSLPCSSCSSKNVVWVLLDLEWRDVACANDC